MATVLAEKFLRSGHQILQIVGRNSVAVHELAGNVQAAAVTHFGKISKAADLYLIAVSDDAIEAIIGQLPLLSGIVAHTAGSVTREVLRSASRAYGVFYPLQSLTKGVESNAIIPVLVDGNNEQTLSVLQSLAESITDQVQTATDSERARLHLAATVVNNFSNHLFALAYEFCKKENLSFDILLPLIRKTADTLDENDPSILQTGPAKRHDLGTLEKHLTLLRDHAKLKEIYTLLSQSIMRSDG